MPLVPTTLCLWNIPADSASSWSCLSRDVHPTCISNLSTWSVSSWVVACWLEIRQASFCRKPSKSPRTCSVSTSNISNLRPASASILLINFFWSWTRCHSLRTSFSSLCHCNSPSHPKLSLESIRMRRGDKYTRARFSKLFPSRSCAQTHTITTFTLHVVYTFIASREVPLPTPKIKCHKLHSTLPESPPPSAMKRRDMTC